MRKYTKAPTIAKAKVKMTKEERRAKYTQIARDRSVKQRQRLEQRNLVCFHCRQRGHGVENCPDKGNKSKCCYKCGSTEHSLHMCPKKNTFEGLPFATCFLCKEQGHLASKCPTNEKGIYVNGGCCKNCGGKDHLSKDCSQKKAQKDKDDKLKGVPEMENYDDLVESSTHKKPADQKKKEFEEKVVKKRRVVNF